MRRTWLYCAVIALCPTFALVAWRVNVAQADKSNNLPATPQAKKLPITQVVLFNTGLGYFQREGEIEDDARIDLSIPATDINDILKTLVIDNGGKPASVSYEGAEPIDHKLRSFAVDLTTNPTLGELLNQSRGQKVELTVDGIGGGAATPMTGTIIGMEGTFENSGRESNHLNLLCTDGARRVALERIQRVRFLDPQVEEEFRRALGVLAVGRSDLRRQVSVHFKGEGKRKVKFGHVAETPIWKATYRLKLDDKKPTLQGWGIVENTSEEDWKDVRVVLVNGRPITFQMDLAQQLFMPRPTLEPEVYASLRPPTFAPATPQDDESGEGKRGRAMPGSGGQQLGAQLGGFQLGGLQLGGGFNFGGNIGLQVGGMVDRFTAPPSLAGFNRYGVTPTSTATPRLSYEELQKRRQEMLEKRKAVKEARELGSDLAELGNEIDDIVTNADRIGEGFRYALEPNVNLPRQRSALLALPAGEVSMSRVSVYAPKVHPRFPLLTVKLKNTSGHHLQQGPVAVYDNGDYVGDCRLPDMQPGNERLLSYAMDLGVEVRPEQKRWTENYTSIAIDKGVITLGARDHSKTVYTILNRSKTDRTVLVEHPITDKWSLTKDGEQPAEKGRQQYRFEWKIESGKRETKAVHETHDYVVHRWLSTAEESFLLTLKKSEKADSKVKETIDQVLAERKRLEELEVHASLIRRYLSTADGSYLLALKKSGKITEKVKESIDKVLAARKWLNEAEAEAAKVNEELRDAQHEWTVAKSTLGVLPAGSEEHKRYLAKFNKYDLLVDKLKDQSKEKNAAAARARKDHEEKVKGLTEK
jgi:hypothetical protein